MTCACPPAGPYSELSCCRWNCDERCPPDRCLHPELTSEDLFAQYRETVALQADAAKRYREAQQIVTATQAEVMALRFEKERLLKAVETAVATEAGADIGTVERASEGLTGARTAAGGVDLG